MARNIVLLVPGPLDAPTGGSIYDRRMVETLRRRLWRTEVVELDASFPSPTQAALDRARRQLADVCTGAIAIVDSLALGAMANLIAREASRLRIVALMHLPVAATVGLDGDTAALVEDNERRALAAAALVVVTGRAALPLLARYDVPPGRIALVEPGTDPAPLARGTRMPVELLCVGTLNAAKGHEMLLHALAAVPERSWHLTCAGSLTRDAATAARVRTAVTTLGLAERVTLAGDLDRDALAACYDRADLFVLATRQEIYGMAVAEALAHGLPVVATTTGAIAELVGSEAGLLVPVGDTAMLTEALTRALNDASLRARLAEGARRVRDRLPTWNHAADRMAIALAALDLHG